MGMEVPELPKFRAKVEAIRHRRNSILIKTIYLTACRPCEILLDASPSDITNNKTSPYGQYVRTTFREIAGNKAFLINMVVAKRHRKAKAEEDRKVRKIIALPVNPDWEPWTPDIIYWIRDHGKLPFSLTEQHTNVIVKAELSGLDRNISTKSLRHYRISHLAEYYDFDAFDLVSFAGWSYRGAFGSRQSVGQLDTYLHPSLRHYFVKLCKPLHEITPTQYSKSLLSTQSED